MRVDTVALQHARQQLVVVDADTLAVLCGATDRDAQLVPAIGFIRAALTAHDRAEVGVREQRLLFVLRAHRLRVDAGDLGQVTEREGALDRVRQHVLALLQHLAVRVDEDHEVRVEVRADPTACVLALEQAADFLDPVGGHQRGHDVVEGRDDFLREIRLNAFLAQPLRLRRLMPLHRLAHQLRYIDRDRLAVGGRQLEQAALVDLVAEFARVTLLHPLDIHANVVGVRAVRPQRCRALEVVARVRQVRPVARLHLVVAVVLVDRVLEELLASVAARAKALGQLGAGLDPLLVFLGRLRILEPLLVVRQQRLHSLGHQLPLALAGGVGHLCRPALHGDRVAVRHTVAVLRVGLVDHGVVLRTGGAAGLPPVARLMTRYRRADLAVVCARFEGICAPVDRLRRLALGDVLPVLVAPALLEVLLPLVARALAVEVEVRDGGFLVSSGAVLHCFEVVLILSRVVRRGLVAGDTLLGARESLRVAGVALERLDQRVEISRRDDALFDPLLLQCAEAGDTVFDDVAPCAVFGFFRANQPCRVQPPEHAAQAVGFVGVLR